jgi:hypothetical protein
MSEVERNKFPSYVIPLFMIWVAVCNVISIILGSIWLNDNSLGFGIVIGINALSIILLYPLFNMDPIKPFLIPALIWYAVVTVVYIILALTLTNLIWWFLIPGNFQLGADIWFHWKLSQISK